MNNSSLKLSRYESKYFNCKKTKILSYLKLKGVPFELLFYNSFESVGTLYDVFVVKGKERWLFDSECFSYSNLKLLDVNVIDKKFSDFADAEIFLNYLLQMEKFILLSGDLYYLEYKQLHYNKSHILHKLVYIGYDGKFENKVHFLLDDNSSAMCDFELRRIDHKKLMDSFNNSNKLVHYIDLEMKENYELNKIIVMEHFLKWLENFECDFNLYDILIDNIKESIANMYYSKLDSIIMVFTKIAGSRSLFATFLNYINDKSATSDYLQECSKQAEIITNLLVRFTVSKKINIETIIEKCKFLKESEVKTINRLKTIYL